MFSDEVTHVVSEMESKEEVLNILKKRGYTINHGLKFVKSQWTFKCANEKKVLDPSLFFIPSNEIKAQGTVATIQPLVISEVAVCRRYPLNHLNHKLTDAFDLMAEYFELECGVKGVKESDSKSLAYRRCSAVLKSLSLPVTKLNISQLKNANDIGPHCFKIIQEIIEYGSSDEVENKRQEDWFMKTKVFKSIYGIGDSLTQKFINEGYGSIVDLNLAVSHGSLNLHPRAMIGLEYFEDILNLPVTRKEAEHVVSIISELSLELLPGVIIENTGGFRRGKETGHDVDILMSHPVKGNESGFLKTLVAKLESEDLVVYGKYITCTYDPTHSKKSGNRSTFDDLEKWEGVIKVKKSIRDEHDLNTKRKLPECSENALAKVPKLDNSVAPTRPTDAPNNDPQTRDWYARRVDLIVAPFDQYYYALVGWSGSKHFVRSLRDYANRTMNMSLTSHHLYNKTNHSFLSANSEREVFDNLNLPFTEPKDRNC